MCIACTKLFPVGYGRYMQSFKFDQFIRYKLHLMGQNLQHFFAAWSLHFCCTSQALQLTYPSEQSSVIEKLTIYVKLHMIKCMRSIKLSKKYWKTARIKHRDRLPTFFNKKILLITFRKWFSIAAICTAFCTTSRVGHMFLYTQ